MLLSLPFVIRIDAIDDTYCADVKGMADEAIFGDSFVEIVNTARDRIIQYFKAPLELADRLKIQLDVNEAASRLMMSRG